MNVKKPGPGALDSLQAELGSNPGSLVPKAIAQGPALPCPLHRPQLCQHQGRGGRLVVFSPGHTAPPSGFLANVCGRPGQQQLASSTLQMSKRQPQGQGEGLIPPFLRRGLSSSRVPGPCPYAASVQVREARGNSTPRVSQQAPVRALSGKKTQSWAT